jgi:flagellar FliJ protein
MNRMHALLTLLQQAESARDAAQLAHQRTQADLQAARAQQTQLLDYRRDNEQRYRTQFSQGSSIEIVRHYQSFMQRLTQAIEQQERIVAQQQRRVDTARETLQQHELQVASIRKLIERRTREKQQRDDKRDQRQTDEAASRAATHKPSMFANAY